MPPVKQAKTSPQSASSRAVSKMPFWLGGFVAFLCLLPLPFGGNRPWASDLFAVAMGVFLGLMVWEEKDRLPSGGDAPRKRLWMAMGCFSIVVVWAFLQNASWMPVTTHHPLWAEAMGVLGQMKSAMAIDKGLLPEALIRFLSYMACFLLAFVAGRDRKRARQIVKALAVAGAAYALYGLVAQAGGGTTILWYKKWPMRGFLTSTFVNKNSYAAYAGIGFLCALAVVWEHFKHYEPKDRVLARQSKMAAFAASLGLKDFALLALPVVLLGALALTGSRAGIASSMVGVAGFFCAMAVHRRWSLRRWGILLGVCLVALLLFVSMGGDALLSRLGEAKIDEDTSMRLMAYDLAMQAIRDNPWFGFGLGSFDGAFHLYRTENLPLWFHHAHNDYIEMMMDLGVPVALVLFAGFAALVSCCVPALRHRRKGGVFPALALGVSALVGVHAFVDFSLHIPAIAATYAALLGLGVAQSWSSREENSRSVRPVPARSGAQGQPAPLRKIAPAPLKKIDPLATAAEAQKAAAKKPAGPVKVREEKIKPIEPAAVPERQAKAVEKKPEPETLKQAPSPKDEKKPVQPATPPRQRKGKEKKETEPASAVPQKKKGKGRKKR